MPDESDTVRLARLEEKVDAMDARVARLERHDSGDSAPGRTIVPLDRVLRIAWLAWQVGGPVAGAGAGYEAHRVLVDPVAAPAAIAAPAP